jgi:invasion protein IalB
MIEDDDYGDAAERRSLFRPLLLVLAIAGLAAIGIVWKGEALDPAFAWVRGAVASVGGEAGRAGEGPAGRRIGAWTAFCDAAAQSCALSQDLRDVGERRLDASLRIEAQPGAMYAIWTLPTGILVRAGMQLHFDDRKPVSVPIDSCEATACEVRAKITPAFVETLRASGVSVAGITLKGGGTQAFRFSHEGLADGLALLPVPEAATARD